MFDLSDDAKLAVRSWISLSLPPEKLLGNALLLGRVTGGILVVLYALLVGMLYMAGDLEPNVRIALIAISAIGLALGSAHVVFPSCMGNYLAGGFPCLVAVSNLVLEGEGNSFSMVFRAIVSFFMILLGCNLIHKTWRARSALDVPPFETLLSGSTERSGHR